jgi:hypothetical protein
MKVLLINYKYTDKTVNGWGLQDDLNDYYVANSESQLKFDFDRKLYIVPFTSKQVDKAVDFVKKKVPNGFDVYVHFCNPVISHTGNSHVITYASRTNLIHEFGHALGFGHANSKLSGELEHSRDPFDQMTMFAPYPSTNAVHRYQLKWLRDTELINYSTEKSVYEICMLKNFDNKKDAKVIFYQTAAENQSKMKRYFVSYGSKKGSNYITIHTIYGAWSSVLIGMYKVQDEKTYSNKESGISLKVVSESGGFVSFEMTTEESEDLLDSVCEIDDTSDPGFD